MGSELPDDGYDYIRVVQTDQPDHTALTTADFNNAGATTNPTPGSFDIDFSSLPSVAAWVGFDLTATTGVAWIKKSGQTSTCGTSTGLTGWTCLGLREGHDVVNSAPATAATGNRFIAQTFEGGTNDAYLLIVYTVAGAAAGEIPQIIFFDEL